MLRIKENVDLKELEKYGFKKESMQVVWWDYEETIIEYYVYKRKVSNKTKSFAINCDTREIEINCIKDFTLNILFDLIQAGLVEKVDDK